MGPTQKDRGTPSRPLAQGYRPVRAGRSAQLNSRGWPQEAALRALMNSLDEEVAERPRELIACGATGKVLRDWDCYHETVKALEELRNDETLVVESGKPAGVFETSEDAPRVLIVNSNCTISTPAAGKSLELAQNGCAMRSQNAAASWTCVGVQGNLQTAFETLAAVGRKHFGGDLSGKLIVSGGMGAAGGALSLAAGLLGTAFLGIDPDEEKIKRRIRTGYCDYCINTLDEALRILKNAVRRKQAVSVGLVGNCADSVPELASRGVVPDILTDQTSAQDLLNGYIPSGLNVEEAASLRRESPEDYLGRARVSIARHFSGMRALQKLGSVVFEFGNGIRAAARESSVEGSSAFSDFEEAYLQSLLDQGRIPVRWIALSGEPGDIRRFDELALEIFPNDPVLARWLPLAKKYVRFQGLPARVCWLGPEARVELSEQVNKLVAQGAFQAPIIIALDYAKSDRSGWTVGRYEDMKDEGDAAGNLRPLDALLKAASGASWIALASGSEFHVTTMTLVADGTSKAARAIPRVLTKKSTDRLSRLASEGLEKLTDTPDRAAGKIPFSSKP